MGILLELGEQLVKLVRCLSFPLPDESLHLTCLSVEDITPSLLVEAWVHGLIVH